MQFLTLLTTILFTLLPYTTAFPTPPSASPKRDLITTYSTFTAFSFAESDITCRTTSTSPLITHVRTAVSSMPDQSIFCISKSGDEIAKFQSGRLVIDGNVGGKSACVKVIDLVDQLVARCKNRLGGEERVEGSIKVPGGQYVDSNAEMALVIEGYA